MNSFSIIYCSLLMLLYDVGASCPNIISRQNWGATPPKSQKNLRTNPPPFVVIHHSETPACQSLQACKQRIRNIQYDHMTNRGWADIGYNFLIGGDGNIYEGRGWGIHGSHVPKYNSKSIGICLIGDFQRISPPNSQLNLLKQLIECGKDNGKIVSGYHLIGHRQGKPTNCPGDALYEEVKKMTNWDPNPN
ncbi:peptidoglycan-recognition protein SB1 [Leptinotarsa decemlineata]|uniref:peptidoglycan-recognition protein SB1 n=1 Tax=Leptinotarsa decemlineata TaxID=7539 RepID=UPI003D30B8FB